MELALARKVIDEAINQPADHTFAMNAVLHVIRDQELRMQDLEATMKPSKGGELEDRIEVAAEEILMVFERHGLNVLNPNYDFAIQDNQFDLVTKRAVALAEMRWKQRPSLGVVDNRPQPIPNLLEQ